jgi:hypothetical protein
LLLYKEGRNKSVLEMSYSHFRDCWLALTRQQRHTSNGNAQQEKQVKHNSIN